MIERDGERMSVSGPVTLENVVQVLEEGRRHLRDGVRAIDLAGVTELDSSLIAALLAWLRDARADGATLSVINLPDGLTTIARLYGVERFLPDAAAG